MGCRRKPNPVTTSWPIWGMYVPFSRFIAVSLSTGRSHQDTVYSVRPCIFTSANEGPKKTKSEPLEQTGIHMRSVQPPRANANLVVLFPSWPSAYAVIASLHKHLITCSGETINEQKISNKICLWYSTFRTRFADRQYYVSACMAYDGSASLTPGPSAAGCSAPNASAPSLTALPSLLSTSALRNLFFLFIRSLLSRGLSSLPKEKRQTWEPATHSVWESKWLFSRHFVKMSKYWRNYLLLCGWPEFGALCFSVVLLSAVYAIALHKKKITAT